MPGLELLQDVESNRPKDTQADPRGALSGDPWVRALVTEKAVYTINQLLSLIVVEETSLLEVVTNLDRPTQVRGF
jgi:hypothetical protein